MNETIAGDIRRIRNLLCPVVDDKGIEVKCNYVELMTLFEAIETKAKALRDENAKLKAALKPVLDIVMDDATSDLAMAEAIDEAHRIYKEGASK